LYLLIGRGDAHHDHYGKDSKRATKWQRRRGVLEVGHQPISGMC
jgi:hypothetical protein